MATRRRCRPPSGPGGRYTYADVDMDRVRAAMAATGRRARRDQEPADLGVVVDTFERAVDEGSAAIIDAAARHERPLVAAAIRTWHLEGWVDKERVHRSVCHGDPALNTAIHGLEARHRGVRLKVWPA